MTDTLQNHISEITHQANILPPAELLSHLASKFQDKVTFSSSLSYEDQVISHMILSQQIDISIFTLDTGRLFPESYAVWNATNNKYKKPIKAYYPDAEAIQDFVGSKGPNSFYESVENRKQCCFIRKVEPLQRALQNNQIWITGLRAEHSSSRQEMPQVEWHASNQIIKVHPILRWSFEEVKQFINQHNIPYNPLHDRGFVSIGCAPCTRAVQPGEDFRAGRWWWEESDKKECGLHTHVVD